MRHFLLIYEIAPDFAVRRAEFRTAHLAHAWAAADRGDLLLGGVTGDPPAGALVLFTGEDEAAAERFAAADPYVTAGLVTGWTVKPWTTVVGADAATPIGR